MRDPETVAGIVGALRQVHGDGVARLLLSDGIVGRSDRRLAARTT